MASSNKPPSDESTTARAVAPGDVLKERYEVVAHIGRGGMADVFHAWDALFNRDVAIKVLKLTRLSEAMKQRVLREARASCAVDHPHMLRVTDMGFAGEAPYLVSDLLRGHSLAEELRRAPGARLGWRRAITLLLPAMDALHAAHQAGLVHRDIKPENLFLHHRRDGSEVPMVLDLGIVKHVDIQGKPIRWTQTGMILGTATYMAPEQASGDPITPCSDVYSMGVTLYRLISGQHLFPLSSGAHAIEAMTHHMYEPPPRLADPALPPALVEAVFVAVTKKPERRHRSMAEFAAALSACLAAPAPAPAPPRPARVHGASYGVLGAVAALVIQQLVTTNAGERAAPTSAPLPCAPCSASPGPPETRLDQDGERCVAPPPDPPLADHELVCSPDPPAELASPPRRGPPSRASLSAASAGVRRCVRDYGAPDSARLTIRATLRRDGSVAATTIPGDLDSPLLVACVHGELAALRFGPDVPRTLEHTYRIKKERP